jgi:hypothetical protein
MVRSVLQDLTDSGLVFRSGVRAAAVYRIAEEPPPGAKGRQQEDAMDSLLWAIIRREGPLGLSALADKTALRQAQLEPAVTRLLTDGRIEAVEGEPERTFRARSIVVPLGARTGWEAATYDHFHALVKTIICKLHQDAEGAAPDDVIGGSTYTFEVWDGHPLRDQVLAQLKTSREATSALREQVDAFNARIERPADHERVTVYVGQCVIKEEN